MLYVDIFLIIVWTLIGFSSLYLFFKEIFKFVNLFKRYIGKTDKNAFRV